MIHNKNESKVETDERKDKTEPIILSSTKSMQVSLHAIRMGMAGLDGHRRSMLNKVLDVGDWASFKAGTINLKDLAYLTAKTGDEFALLRGKKEDVLFHGDSGRCMFDGVLSEILKQIGQPTSMVISAMTGMYLEYSEDPYEM